MSERPQRLYRLVWTDPPTPRDFVSNAAIGRPLPPDAGAETVRLWDGLSSYDRESRARARGKGMPWLGGAFIAELDIPAQATIRVERTTKSKGHYTIWGDPLILLGCVARVVPIRTPGREETPA